MHRVWHFLSGHTFQSSSWEQTKNLCNVGCFILGRPKIQVKKLNYLWSLPPSTITLSKHWLINRLVTFLIKYSWVLKLNSFLCPTISNLRVKNVAPNYGLIWNFSQVLLSFSKQLKEKSLFCLVWIKLHYLFFFLPKNTVKYHKETRTVELNLSINVQHEHIWKYTISCFQIVMPTNFMLGVGKEEGEEGKGEGKHGGKKNGRERREILQLL